MWKNSIYNTLGGLIRLGLGIISVPILTRSLGIEIYGLYATINAVTNIALFSEWSLSTAITVFLSKEIINVSSVPSSLKKYHTLSVAIIFILLLSILTALFIYFSAPWIVSFFTNLSDIERALLKEALSLGAGIVGLRLFIQFFVGVLQSNKAYGIINIISTFYTCITIISTLYISATSKDIIMIQKLQIIITLLASMVYCLFCYRLSYISFNFFTKPQLPYFISICKFGGRAWLSAFGSTLFSQFDRLIILRLLGAEVTGIYSAIMSLVNQINVISSMPVQPLLPVISEYHERQPKNNALESVIIKAFTINAFIIILAGTSLVFFSTEIISIIFGKYSFDPLIVKICLIISTLAYSTYSFNAVGYFSLLAIRKEAFVTAIVLISGIVSLMAIYWLSIKFGIIGACLGNFCYSITLLLNFKSIFYLDIKNLTLLNSIRNPLLISVLLSLIAIVFNNVYISFVLYFVLIVILFFIARRQINLLNFKFKDYKMMGL